MQKVDGCSKMNRDKERDFRVQWLDKQLMILCSVGQNRAEDCRSWCLQLVNSSGLGLSGLVEGLEATTIHADVRLCARGWALQNVNSSRDTVYNNVHIHTLHCLPLENMQLTEGCAPASLVVLHHILCNFSSNMLMMCEYQHS